MDQTPDQPNQPQRRSLLPWIILAVAALSLYLVLAFRPTASTTGQNHPAVGKQLTQIELQPLVNVEQPLALDDLRGKVTLVNFWGTWCGPCAQEFPSLDSLWKKRRDKADFQFVSVSCGVQPNEEEPVSLRAETLEFLRHFKSDIPTYRDEAARTRIVLRETANFRAYPTTFIVDRNLTIRAWWDGYLPGSEHEMANLITQLLAEK